MKLGELKKSLSRMSPDLDDSEIILNTLAPDGKEQLDLLAFTGYAEVGGQIVVFLGSMESANARLKSGNLRKQDGTNPAEDGFNVNG